METLRPVLEGLEAYYQVMGSIMDRKEQLGVTVDIANLVQMLLQDAMSSLGAGAPKGVKTAAVTLIADLWLRYLPEIQHFEGVENGIFEVLKSTLADPAKIVQMVACVSMFQILEIFAVQKKKFAPIILKALVGQICQNVLKNHDFEVQEIYLVNFRELMERNENIPVGLICEPLTTAYATKGQNGLEMFDFDFLDYVSTHPKTNERSTLLIIELLSKVYFEEPASGNMAKVPLFRLI